MNRPEKDTKIAWYPTQLLRACGHPWMRGLAWLAVLSSATFAAGVQT